MKIEVVRLSTAFGSIILERGSLVDADGRPDVWVTFDVANSLLLEYFPECTGLYTYIGVDSSNRAKRLKSQFGDINVKAVDRILVLHLASFFSAIPRSAAKTIEQNKFMVIMCHLNVYYYSQGDCEDLLKVDSASTEELLPHVATLSSASSSASSPLLAPVLALGSVLAQTAEVVMDSPKAIEVIVSGVAAIVAESTLGGSPKDSGGGAGGSGVGVGNGFEGNAADSFMKSSADSFEQQEDVGFEGKAADSFMKSWPFVKKGEDDEDKHGKMEVDVVSPQASIFVAAGEVLRDSLPIVASGLAVVAQMITGPAPASQLDVSTRIWARFRGKGAPLPGKIDSVNHDCTFGVRFENNEYEPNVDLSDIFTERSFPSSAAKASSLDAHSSGSEVAAEGMQVDASHTQRSPSTRSSSFDSSGEGGGEKEEEEEEEDMQQQHHHQKVSSSVVREEKAEDMDVHGGSTMQATEQTSPHEECCCEEEVIYKQQKSGEEEDFFYGDTPEEQLQDAYFRYHELEAILKREVGYNKVLLFNMRQIDQRLIALDSSKMQSLVTTHGVIAGDVLMTHHPMANYGNFWTAGVSRNGVSVARPANVLGTMAFGEGIEEAQRILRDHPDERVVCIGHNIFPLGVCLTNHIKSWTGSLPIVLPPNVQPYNRLTHEQTLRMNFMVHNHTFPHGRIFNVGKIAVVTNHIYNLATQHNIISWPTDPDVSILFTSLWEGSAAIDLANGLHRAVGANNWLEDGLVRLKV